MTLVRNVEVETNRASYVCGGIEHQYIALPGVGLFSGTVFYNQQLLKQTTYIHV